jgi:2-polyprenyl-3-methyl-5-hydroxy-6-metoxy-1,4-benzoquinol methylase
MSKEYNTTQLNPDTTFEKHVFHRDQFAHYLRWTHVLREANIGSKVLDFGCGNANLYEVFYRNRYSPKRYLGLDIRKQTIEKNRKKFPKAEFEAEDLVGEFDYGQDWDFITSFEVAEHVQKKNVPKFLDNIRKHCNPKTTVLLSTPCYDERVGAADNHIYAGGPQELTYNELKSLIEERFQIVKVFGTFASQKDYKPLLNDWQKRMYDGLTEYYDSNLVSVMMAPFFPEQSRNCLWKFRLKNTKTI